jgi:hypothetical protein
MDLLWSVQSAKAKLYWSLFSRSKPVPSTFVCVEVSRRCTVILELVAIVSLHKLIKYSLFFSASRVLCTAFLF